MVQLSGEGFQGDPLIRVAQEVKETGVRTVAYLNQGEPFLSPTIREELEILRESNPGLPKSSRVTSPG